MGGGSSGIVGSFAEGRGGSCNSDEGGFGNKLMFSCRFVVGENDTDLGF